MAHKRTGLGRGIGALIPAPPTSGERPVDVFFPSVSQDTELVAVPGAALAQIAPGAIRPNPGANSARMSLMSSSIRSRNLESCNPLWSDPWTQQSGVSPLS